MGPGDSVLTTGGLISITVKSKFPRPKVDELLDELAGTIYLSKLDLRPGYHQISMMEGESIKLLLRSTMDSFNLRSCLLASLMHHLPFSA